MFVFSNRGSAAFALLVTALAVGLLLSPPSPALATTRHTPGHSKRCHEVHGRHKRCKAKKKKPHATTPTPPSLPGMPPVTETHSSLPGTPPVTEPPSEPQLQPAPPLAQIPPAKILELPEAGDQTLVVSGDESFAEGEFLTTPPSTEAPEGFLLKVVGSSSDGSTTVVQTEPGSIYEAVPNGEIDEDLEDLESAEPMNADARLLDGAAAPSKSGSSGTDVPFSKKVHCDNSAEFILSGALHTSIAPHLDLKWHKYLGIPVALDTAKATLDASVEAKTSGSVSASASCELEPITLLEPEWQTLVEVGAVPVPITIKVPIKLQARASVGGEVSMTATASAHGSLGVAYEDGGIKGIHELTEEASLEHHAEIDADLQVTTGPDFDLTGGWKIPFLGKVAAGFGVGLAAGPHLTYESAEEPPGRLCAHLNLHGSVSIYLPGKTLSAEDENLYDGDIKCVKWPDKFKIGGYYNEEGKGPALEEDTLDAGIHSVYTVGPDGEELENVSAHAELLPSGPGRCREFDEVEGEPGTRRGWVCNWTQPGAYTLTAIYEGNELVVPVIVSEGIYEE